jgi:hypothetical protein
MLDKVHWSFNKVDLTGSGILAMPQFRDSSLRYLISDTTPTPTQMEGCFRQIDTDSDDLISWGQRRTPEA